MKNKLTKRRRPNTASAVKRLCKIQREQIKALEELRKIVNSVYWAMPRQNSQPIKVNLPPRYDR